MTTTETKSQIDRIAARRLAALAPVQQQFARELLAIRDTAAADLRGACTDPEWRADRVNDIVRCNRQLERLGVIPTDLDERVVTKSGKTLKINLLLHASDNTNPWGVKTEHGFLWKPTKELLFNHLRWIFDAKKIEVIDQRLSEG